jgi:hypothetical protein
VSRSVALATAALAAVAAPPTVMAAQSTPATGDQAAALVVQTGFTTGTLAAHGDGSWLLTLQGAPALTAWFTERPTRRVGTIPTALLLETLGFDSGDPPNAALVVPVTADETAIIVLELAQALYDAGAASLTYTATVLEGIGQLPSAGVGFEDAPLTANTMPTEFGPCTLFIDPISPWPP